MWQNRRNNCLEPVQKQGCTRRYPSKLISEIMEQDSDGSEISRSDSEQSIQQPPPLHNHKPTSTHPKSHPLHPQKQNLSLQSNRPQIKYTSYPLTSQKLLQTSSASPLNPYNSLNLQQTSIIKQTPNPNPNEHLNAQNEQLKAERKELMRRVVQLEKENSCVRRQMGLVKEEMGVREGYFGGLEERVRELQGDLLEMKELLQQEKRKNKRTTKKESELSYYIEGLSSQNFNTTTSTTKPQTPHSQPIQKIYSDITAYIIRRVEQLRDRLLQHKMSKAVQDIIQEFMEEMVNINQITVSRVAVGKGKAKGACTPVRRNRLLGDSQAEGLPVRASLFRQAGQASVTPTRPQQKQKQKNQQLRNLQKSLQKLRDMQKSYLSTTPTQNPAPNPNISAISNVSQTGLNKDSYNSLDRSNSLIGLDRSKSRSRRKRIFQ